MVRWTVLGALLFILLAGAIAAGVLLLGASTASIDPPRREGPPALVFHAERPALWILTKQQEIQHGRSRRSGTHHHLELRSHDPETGAIAWRRRLLTVSERDGGHGAQARILGQDGEVAWLFVGDQPLAVSTLDGAPLADRAKLEAVTPALRGWLPRELQFYAFHDGLIATTADARRLRIRAPDYAAEPYRPTSEEAFRRMSFLASQWNGAFRTGDFLVRAGMAGGRWIGMLSAPEAADANEDGFGDKFRDPARIADEGALARRALWTATIGKTRAFSEGRHDRLTEVRPLPDLPFEYLQGSFLAEAGKRTPLALDPPSGFVVVHRSRVDADTLIVLTRLDGAFAPRWTATLPFAEILNRWQLPDRLLLYGGLTNERSGEPRYQEFIVSIALADGRVRGWNITRESALEP